MTKDQTAEKLIRLALENGVPSTKLASFLKALTDVSYINSEYIGGLFRARGIIDDYNLMQDIEHELFGDNNND